MQVELNDTVQNIIDQIVKSESFKNPPDITVSQGSQEGDGYCSKTYAISINPKGKNEKSINLFVKCLPENINSEWIVGMHQVYKAENKFYMEVYPAFEKFQSKRNLEEPFNNVPKAYNVTFESDIKPIVLENLRSLGYTLRDRKKPVDDDHLRLPIKAFARYHAISYAMKDQEPKEFEKLTADMPNLFGENFISFGMGDVIKKCIKQFTDGLDPVLDKKMLEYCKGLDEKLTEFCLNMSNMGDEYSVIIQGDCWSNNMMFLYDESGVTPIDVKLIDWQGQTVSSPLQDFCYFFYTLATKQELKNAETYIDLYYNTLSQRIKELGSNPEKLFPYTIFREYLRKFTKFGLTMALCIIKAQLFENDEIPCIMGDAGVGGAFTFVLKNQDKYISRMKDVVQYFIDNDLL